MSDPIHQLSKLCACSSLTDEPSEYTSPISFTAQLLMPFAYVPPHPLNSVLISHRSYYFPGEGNARSRWSSP